MISVFFNAIQFISGQLPIDPKTGKIIDGDVADQTEQCLTNMGAILTERGLGYENV